MRSVQITAVLRITEVHEVQKNFILSQGDMLIKKVNIFTIQSIFVTYCVGKGRKRVKFPCLKEAARNTDRRSVTLISASVRAGKQT